MKYDIAVIGGGIVGLSVAYNLGRWRPELRIAIIEKEKNIATHQTGSNSGVIHSGVYYKPGSQKAVNCRQGYDLMVSFCKKYGIEYDICGKIIVASDKTEESRLDNIYQRGLENGLKGLKLLDAEALKRKEPHVKGTKAIFVPQAGIVNYKEVSRKLKEILDEKQCTFYFENKVTSINSENNCIQVTTTKNIIEANFMVNCAGLYSDKIAKMNGLDLGAKIIPFRGEYYWLKPEKQYLVKNLIYPVPDPAFPFLGVHFTRRITGEIDAGPNAVLAYSREGYTKRDINISEFLESISYKGFLKVALKYWRVGAYEMYRSYSKTAFTNALKKLIPEIQSDDLVVGNAGVRAQLCDKNGKLVDDFMIKYTERAVHVINAPSPAATASLQIGKTIVDKIANQL